MRDTRQWLIIIEPVFPFNKTCLCFKCFLFHLNDEGRVLFFKKTQGINDSPKILTACVFTDACIQAEEKLESELFGPNFFGKQINRSNNNANET